MITKTQAPSDTRWFIWTIVFLIVSGVSLVSYIMITDISQTAYAENTVVSGKR